MVDSKGPSCSGRGYAGVGWKREEGRAGAGGLLTRMRWVVPTRRAHRSNGGGTKWPHCRPATGSRTPNPADHKADKAARPAGEFAPVILAKEPPAQAAKGGKIAKAEGMRGLRAKAQGNNGLGRWRYELFRALTRACLAGLRTFSTGRDARGGHRHTSGVGPPAYHWAGQSYW